MAAVAPGASQQPSCGRRHGLEGAHPAEIALHRVHVNDIATWDSRLRGKVSRWADSRTRRRHRSTRAPSPTAAFSGRAVLCHHQGGGANVSVGSPRARGVRIRQAPEAEGGAALHDRPHDGYVTTAMTHDSIAAGPKWHSNKPPNAHRLWREVHPLQMRWLTAGKSGASIRSRSV
jgi:hypothetical protein